MTSTPSATEEQIEKRNGELKDSTDQREGDFATDAGKLPSSAPVRGSLDAPAEKPRTPSPGQMLQVSEQAKARKSSTVSFKDVCELFEIDLEQGARPRKPAAVFSLRYYIMILALVSPFVVTYSRTIINFALIDMIDPNYLSSSGGHQQQQLQLQQPTTTTETTFIAGDFIASTTSEPTNSTTISTNTESYFDWDNSCPVDGEARRRLNEDLAVDKERAESSSGEKFEWDTVRQGLLKAAYSIGHMLLQVMGGRLSEIYGSHLIMGLSSALIGLACLLAPLLASAHFYLLFVDLLVLGILGSFMTPALITLFSNWLTPSEKSMMLSFYLVSSRLGYALSSLRCGLLIQAQLSWRYLFFSAGWIAIVFSLTFLLCSRSRPHEHPLIGQEELNYLAFKNTLVREALGQQTNSNRATQMRPLDEQQQQTTAPKKTTPKAGAPWLAILTNVPVWAFITTKFCVKLAGDTVQIELPTYLKRVMHLAPKNNGLINASNYVIFCLSCLLVGMLAKSANKRRPFGWSKTTVRKVFQFTASSGASLALLGISLSVCKQTETLCLLMLMFFFTTFSTGGEAQIPLDISERYAGTIHAIGSSLAISGVIEPILVGYILRDSPADQDRWAGVWMGASAIALLGGIVFLLFGDASIQPFDGLADGTLPTSKKDDDDDQKEKPKKLQAKVMDMKPPSPNGHDNGSFEADDENQEEKVPYRESVQI